MKKILSLIITLLCIGARTYAETIPGAISGSGINKGAVAVSVKDISDGKTVYALHRSRPMPPASTLKILTFAAALDTLGMDYEFKTSLYKNAANDLILKLGADPYFTVRGLNSMMRTAKEKQIAPPAVFYIDDSVIDDKEWGEGWQWDDDLNVLMPKFSAYNIDGNLLTVMISPTTPGAPAQIRTDRFYPVTFSNLVTTGGKKESLKFSRSGISPDIINVEGSVKSQMTKQIPLNNPKRYFILRLEDAIRNEKLGYYDDFKPLKTPADAVLVSEIKHTMAQAAEDILKNSNNLAAETVFKIAGGKFSGTTGTEENSRAMLKAYASKIGLELDGVRITDGSGVSKNNLVTADLMSDFLVKSSCSGLKDMLATAGEGTLATRMLYFKDDIRAKTGTLSDVSAIAGYITARSGKTYAFDIMINDPKSSESDKKSLEEHILRAIQANY